MPYNNTITTENNTAQAINDFIGNPPGFLLKSGITIIGIVTLALLTLAAIINYPDKIVSQGIMTSAIPPIELKSPSNGIIENIYIKDGDTLTKNDPVLYIRNTANVADIATLELFIKQIKNTSTLPQLLQLHLPNDLQLGVLQADYAALILKLNELRAITQQTGNAAQIKNLAEEIQKLQKLNQTARAEADIFKKELVLIEKEYNRATTLASDGIMSTQEKEKIQSQLLQAQRQQKSMAKSIIQNDIQIEQLELQQIQLNEERQKQLDNYQFYIKEIVSRLQSAARHWKDSYAVNASADGIFHFHSDIVKNQQLAPDQLIGYLLSLASVEQKYIKTLTPAAGIGKINIGDKVIIKMDGYPYKEYGTLTSQVGEILPFPIKDQTGNSFYEIKIPLAASMQTNYGKLIPFKPNTGLQAEIITADKTILERIFTQFLDLIKNP